MVAKNAEVYEMLRQRIVSLDLRPGTQLSEGLLGVGRTPFREAIQRLAAEKLVIAHSRQTPYVAPILAQELSALVEMRAIIEIPAARFAALRGKAAERQLLLGSCERFRAAAFANDTDAILATDNEIHGLISSMARNFYLADYFQRISVFSHRIWRLSTENARNSEDFPLCHDDLVLSICRGDTEDAARAAASHVEMFRNRLTHIIIPQLDDVAASA